MSLGFGFSVRVEQELPALRNIARRQFVSRGLAAVAVGAASFVVRHPQPTDDVTSDGGVVPISWDPSTASWPSRPQTTGSLILFISTSDAAAPAPLDFDLMAGDVWWRHPLCPQTVERSPVPGSDEGLASGRRRSTSEGEAA